MTKKHITRRQALKNMAYGAAGSFLLSNLPLNVFGRSRTDTSKVVLIRDKNLHDNAGSINKQVLRDMLDKAIPTLTGDSDPKTAWSKIVKPEDTVGIKSNEWNKLPTPSELEQLIKENVMNTGVNDDKISIDDRGVLNDSVFQNATALINSRPMRTHHWAGVGSLMKNYIMFVDNPSAYHPDTCADLAKIWKKPIVKGKTRLNILVMFTPLFHSVGPHDFNAEYTWQYNGLIAGFDPVAVDATGLRIIRAKRDKHFGEERPISPPPKHVELADTRHKLGNAKQENIELVKLGWQDGVLI